MVRYQVFDARDLLAFPGGDNSTDTVFGDVHFNTTTLTHWNYTYYSNGTLSNNSECWLTYKPYEPVLLHTNGSFVNATSCYSAVELIGTRGYTGIGFAVMYGLALMLTLTVLAKHGKLYLPIEKRFYPIGRRWQWYWGSFVCACALISLFTNIDIDRYHVQELPIIVTSFFWFLICQGTTALVWEAVRHWGSWQERQFVDPNPFVYGQDDRRAKIEFYLPLWFYFWTWMNFFMVVPRSWNFVEMQRSPEQTAAIFVPSATGARFKAGAFCLVISWLTICFSLSHSIQHYKTRNPGLFNQAWGYIRALPFRFILIIPLNLALIAYQVLISFDVYFSVMRYGGSVPIIFAWGYGPSLLILYIQIIYGIATMNEDKALILQRRERGEVVDQELGIVKKPAWWRRVRGEHLHSLRDKISNNVNEIGGKRGAGRRIEDDMERDARLEAEMALNEGDIELSSMTSPRVDRAGAGGIVRNDTRRLEGVVDSFADSLAQTFQKSNRAHRASQLVETGPPPPYTDEVRRESRRRRGSASTSNSITAPPQQVKSMLDI